MYPRDQYWFKSSSTSVLFHISLNDLDDEAEDTPSKFGDDTKLGRVADTLQGHAALSGCRNGLTETF